MNYTRNRLNNGHLYNTECIYNIKVPKQNVWFSTNELKIRKYCNSILQCLIILYVYR